LDWRRKKGGTDGKISVSLNDNNKTVLNTGSDDFKAGYGLRYDLSWRNVYRLSDIRYLKLHNASKDGWCLNTLYFSVDLTRWLWGFPLPTCPLVRFQHDRALFLPLFHLLAPLFARLKYCSSIRTLK
jgi:hypothetical protein